MLEACIQLCRLTVRIEQRPINVEVPAMVTTADSPLLTDTVFKRSTPVWALAMNQAQLT